MNVKWERRRLRWTNHRRWEDWQPPTPPSICPWCYRLWTGARRWQNQAREPEDQMPRERSMPAIKDSSDTRHRISQLRGGAAHCASAGSHACPRMQSPGAFATHDQMPRCRRPSPIFFLPQGSHPHSKTTRKPQTCCAPHRGVLRVTSGSPLLASSESLDTMSVRRRRFLASHRTHKIFACCFSVGQNDGRPLPVAGDAHRRVRGH